MKSFYATKEWKEARKKALEVNNKCTICNSQENVDIHHKKKVKEGGDNSINNLIALCSSHHHKIHILDNFYKNNHSIRSFERLFQEVLNKHGRTV